MSKTLTKYEQEQMIRFGGVNTGKVALVSGISGYLISQFALKVTRVPYRLMYFVLGYSLGSVAGSIIYGDRSYYAYYTPEEARIIREQIGPAYMRNIRIIQPGEQMPEPMPVPKDVWEPVFPLLFDDDENTQKDQPQEQKQQEQIEETQKQE
ncbi:UNKNOWN [Stylonychia lemnae]|uniref:Transmembrane protein n=1 Tax=Stylonychia lemnae TaxID=5949 RepID=A0A078B7N9_STYLE|nr:UNKNOWN [Stylonychia lemnae]|eukprot:CDW90389.1 UNKNOWN [Stylonychia lemnae]